MDAGQISDARKALADAERSSGQERRAALTTLATQLDGNASQAGDQAKARKLAAAVADLANVKS